MDFVGLGKWCPLAFVGMQTFNGSAKKVSLLKNMKIAVTPTPWRWPKNYTNYTIRIIIYYTILYYNILYYIILYYTILYYTTIQYNTILYCTILYYVILYYTITCYTILWYTILYPVCPFPQPAQQLREDGLGWGSTYSIS